MRKNYYYYLSMACLFLISNSAISQSFWLSSNENEFEKGRRDIQPNKFKAFTLDFNDIQSTLLAAPSELDVNPHQSNFVVGFPNPEGKVEGFKLVEYSMMEEDLANKYPEIKTYRGVHIKNPYTRIRVDITARGIRAMIYAHEGNYYIDPYSRANKSEYVVYYKKDYPKPLEAFICETEGNVGDNSETHQRSHARSGDCIFRSYRLAMATTGEYSNFHGANSASDANLVLSAITTTMNRVNGIYEIDATVRMILVNNTDQVFYYNPSSDPYSNTNGGAMLSQNQTTIDNEIGFGNYDIGHVFSTGGGGVAYLRSVCGGSKAGGVTGQSSPVGDPFDVDYVAHEIGHQFGGNHTQNNSCQRSSQSYEPGSASTIMGYAGICNPNVQSNSDDYFHGISVVEMGNFVTTGNGNSCDTPLPFSNNAPTVDAGANYTIPKSTPFVLTANATDQDNDPMTYCWEQWDPEVGSMPPSSTNTQGPMFRTLDPSPDPQRYFPALNNILNNSSTTWEVLPSVSRNMDFVVTVRDNNGEAGCNDSDTMSIVVDGNAGPFLVLSPNTNVTWGAGASENVTWDVAGTNGGSINCANVDILLSTDGGNTFSSIASSVPNNGSANVSVPSGINTTQARVRVQCSDNIFFDISNQNFTIEDVFTYDLSTTDNDETSCNSEDLMYQVNVGALGGYTDPVTLNAINVPSGASVSFSTNPVTPGNSTTVTVTGLNNVANGSYTITIQGSSTAGIKTLDLIARKSTIVNQITLSSPLNNAIDVSNLTSYEWQADAEALSYDLEVSKNLGFTDIVLSQNVNIRSYTASMNLDPGLTYFWRVRGVNDCGPGNWQTPFRFVTENCVTYTSTDTPLRIPASGTSGLISAQIDVPNLGTVTDVDVAMNGTHTYMADLDVELRGPTGLSVVLFTDKCGSNENFDIGFDDEASSAIIPCPPTDGLDYQPQGALNDFDGLASNGIWSLDITDDASGDVGNLESWSITICIEPVEACDLEVTSSGSSGPGSLVDVLDCATNGDTITFAPSINGQFILLNNPLQINKDVYIKSSPSDNISIFPSGTIAFHIQSGTVEIEGLTIYSGTAIEGRAILNEGILTIRDITVLENFTPPGSGNKLKNLNELFVEGNCDIE
ncbi:MAG: reprolysin-like metallopeptidase [Bacteroidota bacterium]